MSALTISELTQDITPEEIACRAKIEGLINLGQSLRADREAVAEMVGEVIEQRREELLSLDLDPTLLDDGLVAFELVFSGLESLAQKAQFAAIREQRS